MWGDQMKESRCEQTYEVGEECVIVIETTSGDVRVQGWDKAQVAVEPTDEPAAITQSGQTLNIRSVPGGAEDLAVRVPQGCDLVLHLVSGDVRLDDVVGDISVQTMSGDIEARSIQGEARVRTVSGDIALLGSQLSGLSVETVSGDGTIETSIAEGGHYSLHSISGDLRLLIPEDQPCAVHGTSLSGEFSCRLPHEIKHQGWGKVEVLINGGGPEIHIRTTSGDVEVRAAGRLPEPAAEREAKEPSSPEHEAEEPSESGRATKPLEAQGPEPKTEPFHVEEAKAPTVEAEATQSATARRMEVLKAIEEGRMSVSEGLAKLRQLE
jgi:hypothetical protein